jgi:hypothetical protein
MVRLLRCAAPHQGLGDFPKVLKDRFSYLGRESPKRREPILLNFAFVYTNAMLARAKYIKVAGCNQAERNKITYEGTRT